MVFVPVEEFGASVPILIGEDGESYNVPLDWDNASKLVKSPDDISEVDWVEVPYIYYEEE